jgi:hypothetical protein
MEEKNERNQSILMVEIKQSNSSGTRNRDASPGHTAAARRARRLRSGQRRAVPPAVVPRENPRSPLPRPMVSDQHSPAAPRSWSGDQRAAHEVDVPLQAGDEMALLPPDPAPTPVCAGVLSLSCVDSLLCRSDAGKPRCVAFSAHLQFYCQAERKARTGS